MDPYADSHNAYDQLTAATACMNQWKGLCFNNARNEAEVTPALLAAQSMLWLLLTYEPDFLPELTQIVARLNELGDEFGSWHYPDFSDHRRKWPASEVPNDDE